MKKKTNAPQKGHQMADAVIPVGVLRSSKRMRRFCVLLDVHPDQMRTHPARLAKGIK